MNSEPMLPAPPRKWRLAPTRRTAGAVALSASLGFVVFLVHQAQSPQQPPAAFELAAADACTDILRQGMFDKFQSSDHFATASAIESYDESYSYEQYSKDYAAAQASDNSASSAQGSKSGGSVGFKLFHASGSHAQSSSESSRSRQLSRSEFATASAEIVAAKKFLSSSDSSGKSSKVVSESVSPEVTQMYNQCIKFQNDNMQIDSKLMKNGMMVVSAKYTLGNGKRSAVAPKITGVVVQPSTEAKCALAPGNDLPLELDYGLTYNIVCTRRIGTETPHGVDIAIMTNTDAGTFTATMPDVVFEQEKEEHQKQLQRFRGTVQDTVDRARSDLQKNFSDGLKATDAKINSASAQANSAMHKANSAMDRANSAMDRANSAMDKGNSAWHRANSACTLCQSCGGNYPADMANLPIWFEGHLQLPWGQGCANNWPKNSWQKGVYNVHFCCK